MRLLEFTDSTLPVGSFSFSIGLESAVVEGVVHDETTLEEFTAAAAHAAATSDAVGAIAAYRAFRSGQMRELRRADRCIVQSKPNAERRRQSLLMGHKLASLASRILDDNPTAKAWLDEVAVSRTRGSYAAVQGVVFAACGISERALFCSHQYGVISTILNAALRIMKISHYQTQEILYRLGANCDQLYKQVEEMTLDEIHSFSPEADLLAALHEKGTSRMFMN